MTKEQIDFYRQAAENGSLPDGKNPLSLFSITNTDLLVMIASGKLDAKFLANYELEQRGLSQQGLWVGFKDNRKKNDQKKSPAPAKRKNKF